MSLMPEKYGPLNRDGGVNQGYLYTLPPHAGRFLLDQAGGPNGQADAPITKALENGIAQETECRALVLSRIGQGRFRDRLLDYWRSKCCVSGLSIPCLLRAAHIKPWCDSNNAERMDVFNGLLLSPSYDAAFDQGLITFSDDGQIQLSSRLPEEEARRLGIYLEARIEGLQQQHRQYLAYHRDLFPK
jgi:predicted restriction endonuclease